VWRPVQNQSQNLIEDQYDDLVRTYKPTSDDPGQKLSWSRHDAELMRSENFRRGSKTDDRRLYTARNQADN